MRRPTMDLETLTTTMHAFVNDKGWYAEDSPKSADTDETSPYRWYLEASEVLEHFQWSEQAECPDGLADELADVMLYLLQLASISGIDLGQAVLDKLEKNYSREWRDRPNSSV